MLRNVDCCLIELNAGDAGRRDHDVATHRMQWCGGDLENKCIWPSWDFAHPGAFEDCARETLDINSNIQYIEAEIVYSWMVHCRCANVLPPD